MLTGERRAKIAEVLIRDGRVIAAELSAQFGVSEDTVRRDLREMASDGLLERVYGGAVPRSPVAETFKGREKESPAAKRAIAQAAAARFTDGQVVIFDGGTTVLEVARHIPPERKLTAVTHSLAVATALATHPSVDVLFIGGMLQKELLSMAGATTVAGYQRVRADVCVMSVHSFHFEIGLGVFQHEDAEVKRAIIASSERLMVVASSEKLGTSAPFIIAPVYAVDELITDELTPQETVKLFVDAGVEVVRGKGS